MSQSVSLKDQVVVITGGTSGIGRGIADMFASCGAKVVLFGRDEERGKRAADELGGNAEFFSVDVANTDDVNKAIETVLAKHGCVDILINCAGVTRDKLLMRMDEEDWDQVLEINLKSCYNTCKALVRPMLKAKKGKIINISSVVGLMGNPGQTNYAASKAGMIGFSKALAKELAGRVQVNCIAPGYIETKMTDSLSSSQKQTIVDQIPMKRIGRPEEVAYAALFLASPWSDYITGQVLTVDGGMVM